MKYLSWFIYNRIVSHPVLHFHVGQNYLRLNMFSTRSQLWGIGLQFASLNRSFILKTRVNRKQVCSHFSYSVNVEGEMKPPVAKKRDEQPKRVKKEVTENHSKQNTQVPWTLAEGKQFGTSAALLENLKKLMKRNERDPQILHALSNELLNSDFELNVKSSTDLLFYLSILNIHNEPLLMKLLDHLSDLLGEIYKPSPLIVAISKSLRNLQVRNTKILNGLLNWFLEKERYLNVEEAADLIQTLAVLNYIPAEADVLLKEIMKNNVSDYILGVKYLNFVWSVALMDRLQPELAETVLVPIFRKKIESIIGSSMRTPIYLKLINIHALANLRKFKINLDSDWYTTQNSLYNYVKEKRLRESGIRSFLDCLANIMPIRTFTTFVETGSGFVIDAVCFFNNDHVPITELELVKNKNGFKLAIIFLLYKDLCLPGKTHPNGIIVFHKRILEASKYKVMLVPANEFALQESLKDKSAYIKEKIGSVLSKYDGNVHYDRASQNSGSNF